jgi:hypothetical protein
LDKKGAYLFGTGGSGMTYLKRKLGWVNKEPESTQHFRYLNKEFMGVKIDIPTDSKIVYLFAHPFDVLLSFERRGFLAKYDMAVANLQGNIEKYRKLKIHNLNDYVNHQKDLFMFGHHFNSLYNLPNKVLFIKYEKLNENIKFIARWSGVSIDTNEELKDRESNFSKCDCKTLKGLIDIHGGWADHYNNLPDYFTNKGIKHDFLNKTKFDYLYK